MKNRNKVLVLGATGGIGGEIARKLIREKWDVHALRRSAPQNEEPANMTWITGDALNAEQVAAAASECSVIVHAVNPPGYRNWEQLVLPMLQNTINAAERNGALIVLPGTVYNYGPDAFPLLREDSPQNPVTRKGAIRVQMEKALNAYTQRGGKVLILRAGDFFGPDAGNNWFSQGWITPGKLPGQLKIRVKPEQAISGPICRMSPKRCLRCWRVGSNSNRLPVFICGGTGMPMVRRWQQP